MNTEHFGQLGACHGVPDIADAPNLVSRESGIRAALNVDGSCDWLHMVRFDAASNPAKVIELQPIGNGAVGRFPFNDMRMAKRTVDANCSISVRVYAPLPDVARRCVSALFNQVARSSKSALMSANKANVFTPNVAPSLIVGDRGDSRCFATTAHAQAGRIRRGWFTLEMRHSLTSYIGRGVRRTGNDASRCPVFCCVNYSAFALKGY